MFPFTYAGVEHSACTWADSPVPWCAVARAANGSVAANRWEERHHARWGDCEVSSPALCEVEPIQLPTCITTSPAPVGHSKGPHPPHRARVSVSSTVLRMLLALLVKNASFLFDTRSIFMYS